MFEEFKESNINTATSIQFKTVELPCAPFLFLVSLLFILASNHALPRTRTVTRVDANASSFFSP
jgi:hypothetical protein